jgi:murein DD-endopeptidase MepM/ murein hydrolase activator NlpD
VRPPSNSGRPGGHAPRHRAPRRTLADRLRRPLRIATAVVGAVALTLGMGAVWVTIEDPGRIAAIVSSDPGDVTTRVADDDVRDDARDRASRGGRVEGSDGLPSGMESLENATQPRAKPTTMSVRKAKPSPKPTRKPAPRVTRKAEPKPEPSPSRLADGRPNFQLPFTCGQRWRFTTYANHNPEDAKIDFFYQDGETRGQPVLASAPGTVAKLLPEIGAVKIDHGQRWTTMYNHMDPIMVEVGQKVAQGEQIGRAGSIDTGVPHVHYEQIYDADNDGHGASPYEIVHPIIQGVEYSLHAGEEPIKASTNNC